MYSNIRDDRGQGVPAVSASTSICVMSLVDKPRIVTDLQLHYLKISYCQLDSISLSFTLGYRIKQSV
jgi:hypothetical protein